MLNSEEAKEMAHGNEISFLRVNKPEIDCPDVKDQYDPAVYLKGKENLEKFKEKGIIVQDTEQRMYIYQLTMEGRKQTGVLASAHIDDYANGLIKRHELTLKKKEEDRTKLSNI